MLVADREGRIVSIDVAALAAGSDSRFDLWATLLRDTGARSVAEVGVFKGAFAQAMLDSCPEISTYYMIDPWRHLEDWAKPANKSDDAFARFLDETLARTAAHADKRVVLRGRTTEVVEQIPDESLDFAYVDGDHTLRGITIDLLRIWPKLRAGAWLAGDDLHESIFHHGPAHEPTLVFPWSLYFAEAMGTTCYVLPHQQFLVQKLPSSTFEVVDLSGGHYRDRTLKAQYDRLRGAE